MLMIFRVWFTALQAMGKLVSLALVGVLAAKMGLLTDAARTSVAKLVYNIFLPALLFSRISNSVEDIRKLYEWWPVAFFPLCNMFISFFVAQFIGVLFRLPLPIRRVFVYCMTFTNVVYCPLSILEVVTDSALFDHDVGAQRRGTAYLSVYLVVFSLVFWNFGYIYVGRNAKFRKDDGEKEDEEVGVEDVGLLQDESRVGLDCFAVTKLPQQFVGDERPSTPRHMSSEASPSDRSRVDDPPLPGWRSVRVAALNHELTFDSLSSTITSSDNDLEHDLEMAVVVPPGIRRASHEDQSTGFHEAHAMHSDTECVPTPAPSSDGLSEHVNALRSLGVGVRRLLRHPWDCVLRRNPIAVWHWKLWYRLPPNMRVVVKKVVINPPFFFMMLGFAVGVIAPARRFLWNEDSPIRIVVLVVEPLGNCALPCALLLLGSGLLYRAPSDGFLPSKKLLVVFLLTRLCILPTVLISLLLLMRHLGLLISDPVFLLVLILESSTPSAVNCGVVVQTIGVGKGFVSRIMFWAYVCAALSLTVVTIFALGIIFGF